MAIMAGLVNANMNEDKTHHAPGDDKDDNDMFGMEDDDWDVYRGINKIGYSDEDEED
jgi:hypothetical protein